MCARKASLAVAASVVVTAAATGTASAAVAQGSIAFTGFNADGTDSLAFVALAPIAAGEVLYLTDQEWDGTAFNTGESAFTWTAGAAGVAQGEVVLINDISTTPVSNLGTVTYIDSANVGVSNSDETIYVFQGSNVGATMTPTTFITAVTNDPGAAFANGSLDNTGLAYGTNAANLALVDLDLDIAAYTGSRSDQSSFAAYGTILNNPSPATWNFQDASGDQSIDTIAPDVPFSTTAFTVPEPTGLALVVGAVLLTAGRRRR